MADSKDIVKTHKTLSLAIPKGRGRQTKAGMQAGRYRWIIYDCDTAIAYGPISGKVEKGDALRDGMVVFNAMQADEQVKRAQKLAEECAVKLSKLNLDVSTERDKADRYRWHRKVLSILLALVAAVFVFVIAVMPVAAAVALTDDEVRQMIGEAFAVSERITLGGMLNEIWFVSVATLVVWLLSEMAIALVTTPHPRNPLQGFIRPDEDEARKVSKLLGSMLEDINAEHALQAGGLELFGQLANATAQRNRARIVAGAIRFGAIYLSMFIAFAPMAKGMLRQFF